MHPHRKEADLPQTTEHHAEDLSLESLLQSELTVPQPKNERVVHADGELNVERQTTLSETEVLQLVERALNDPDPEMSAFVSELKRYCATEHVLREFCRYLRQRNVRETVSRLTYDRYRRNSDIKSKKEYVALLATQEAITALISFAVSAFLEKITMGGWEVDKALMYAFYYLLLLNMYILAANFVEPQSEFDKPTEKTQYAHDMLKELDVPEVPFEVAKSDDRNARSNAMLKDVRERVTDALVLICRKYDARPFEFESVPKALQKVLHDLGTDDVKRVAGIVTQRREKTEARKALIEKEALRRAQHRERTRREQELERLAAAARARSLAAETHTDGETDADDTSPESPA